MNISTGQAFPLYLGIDTGGTHTDAVLWSEGMGIVAKAKSLTTRHDLAQCIGGAVDAVVDESGISSSAIKLVSMSTTLATNALIEGQGGRVALVMIGFAEGDLVRSGLAQALGTDPVIFCPGGQDVHGDPDFLIWTLLRQRCPLSPKPCQASPWPRISRFAIPNMRSRRVNSSVSVPGFR